MTNSQKQDLVLNRIIPWNIPGNKSTSYPINELWVEQWERPNIPETIVEQKLYNTVGESRCSEHH